MIFLFIISILLVIVIYLLYKILPSQKQQSETQNLNIEQFDQHIHNLCESIYCAYNNRTTDIVSLCCIDLEIINLTFNGTITPRMVEVVLLKRYNLKVKNVFFTFTNCFYSNGNTLCIKIKI